MLRTLLSILCAGLLATACAGEARVGARTSYAVATPELVYVSPGVYVVAELDAPVFYASNYYWRYDGGVWYRSRTHTGGWRVTHRIPVAVRRIDRPAAYVHYRGERVRDHRRNAPPRAASSRDHRRAPRVRDHRR